MDTNRFKNKEWKNRYHAHTSQKSNSGCINVTKGKFQNRILLRMEKSFHDAKRLNTLTGQNNELSGKINKSTADSQRFQYSSFNN